MPLQRNWYFISLLNLIKLPDVLAVKVDTPIFLVP